MSQNYQTVEDINNACSQLGFSADEDAEIAVAEIMEVIGLQKNFTIQECPEINNAVAKNIKNSSGEMVRYILYDNNFFNNIDAKAGNDWAAISILAHEIGHHLNGHALNNEGSNHEFELDADYFSGLILAKMGATLEETQSAINTFRYEKATRTHPAKQDRLNEIERGWTKGSNFINRTSDTRVTGEEETDIPEGMDPLVQEQYRKAKNGDAQAQSNLGFAYSQGEGVKKDYDIALKWLHKSAGQGNAEGQSNLGYMYSNGYGVERDNSEALKWYRMAAEQGGAHGQYRIGVYYQIGSGGQKDLNEALKWYRKAAEQGYVNAQYMLGRHYYYGGDGVETDYNEAVKWHRKAAVQGNAGSEHFLGIMHENGYGVEQDYDEAVKWYRKSAEQGYAIGQNSLGFMYQNGYGVEKDYYEAIKWYRKAAESNYGASKYAEYNLGVMYQNGYGVTKNSLESISWFKKAAKNGVKDAQDELTKIGESW